MVLIFILATTRRPSSRTRLRVVVQQQKSTNKSTNNHEPFVRLPPSHCGRATAAAAAAAASAALALPDPIGRPAPAEQPQAHHPVHVRGPQTTAWAAQPGYFPCCIAAPSPTAADINNKEARHRLRQYLDSITRPSRPRDGRVSGDSASPYLLLPALVPAGGKQTQDVLRRALS